MRFNVKTETGEILESDQYNHIKEIHFSPGGTNINHVIWAMYRGDDDWEFDKIDNPELIDNHE